MDLRCRKTNCKFNQNLTCTARDVKISDKTVCMDYKYEKGKGDDDFSKMIFTKETPKIADYKHLKDTCLKCDAKCLFNRDTRCIANGITVNMSANDTPKCMTFMKP